MASGEAREAAQRFRWDVKTLQDRAAARVNFTPFATSVRVLAGLPAPDAPLEGDTPRLRPWEFRTFVIPVRLMRARHEGDGDIHVVVRDLHTDARMVVELPSVRPGRKRREIAAAHRHFVQRFGMPPMRPDWLPLEEVHAHVYGVGFFDFPHAVGHPPNGFELHPVLGHNVVHDPASPLVDPCAAPGEDSPAAVGDLVDRASAIGQAGLPRRVRRN